MEKLKTIIVDDESPGRENLASIVSVYLPELRVIGMAGDVESAYNMICENQPELVFLDIELGDGTGLDLLNRFDVPEFYTIFVTAYDQYAVKAFRAQAIDYILKPIDIDELKACINRYEFKQKTWSENIKKANQILQPNTKIAIPDGNNLLMIDTKDIIYLKADNSYTSIHLKNGKTHITSRFLKNFEEHLKNNSNFFRCHKSYIINTDYVKSFSKSNGGTILLENEFEIPLSPDKSEELLLYFTKIER